MVRNILILIMLGGCTPPQPPKPRPATPTPSSLWFGQLDEMMRRTRSQWVQYGPDGADASEGFHAVLDRRWQPPRKGVPKGLLQQARSLWTVSRWYRETPGPQHRQLAFGLYRFIAHKLCHTRPFCKLTEPGGEDESGFLTYIHSFAIYSLSEFALAFDHQGARRLALQIFESLETQLLDRERHGYVDAVTQKNGTACQNQSHCKSGETQLHLMEAFTALYETTHDERVKKRLLELIRIIITKMVHDYRAVDYSTTYLPDHFHRDWTPFERSEAIHTNFGHDLQIIWLLWDTCHRVLRWEIGLPRKHVVNTLTRLGLSAAEHGYDDEHGGYYEKGNHGEPRTPRYKDWWAQFESLQGLFRLAKLLDHPDQRTVPKPKRRATKAQLLRRFHRTMQFVYTRQFDHRHAGFFGRLDPSGTRQIGDRNKANHWKAGYHSMRGMLNLIRWLKATR